MRICVLHNHDHDCLDEDPGREARAEVERVASAVAGALETLDHEVEILPVGSDLVGFVDALRKRPPALVMNLCESLAADSRGEVAVPCLLDLLGVPYTGSSPLALGLALHKPKAKELLAARGIPTPAFQVVERVEDVLRLDLPFPLIVKPCREDASVGVHFGSVVNDKRQLARAARQVLRELKQPALVERYVDGREIYVSILGNRSRRTLPLREVRFGPAFADKPKIVSYEAKWDEDSAECMDSSSVPCTLPRELEQKVLGAALASFEALDCRDYGRVDIRLSAEGEPFVIDINPNCDLHPAAGFAKAAAAAGTDYPSLVRALAEIALERSHGDTTRRPPGPRTARGAARPDRDLLAGGSDLRARAHRRRAQAE